ncbi:hypothetical protein FOZ63_007960 [Perkinsus olseni]|uniref:Uncharacterized protein n=1 Tax=Perkinsus olseni TaxID=32597 RepID=A0A7J6Q672_PEROL|nr:hypothetical protein FOZ62_029244 [Perkinsus olseni]KAF4742046.1 hypothetical protein FOZ63_007960 [Perkinsus olseni]
MTFDVDKDGKVDLTFEVPGEYEPFYGMPFPLVGGPTTYTLDDEAVFQGELFQGVTLWYHGIRVLLPEAEISPVDLRTLTYVNIRTISATFQGRELHFSRITPELTPGVFHYEDPRDGRFEITVNFHSYDNINTHFWCHGKRGARATFSMSLYGESTYNFARGVMLPRITASSFSRLLVHLCGVEEPTRLGSAEAETRAARSMTYV